MSRVRVPKQRPEVHYWNSASTHVGFWIDALRLQRSRVVRELDSQELRTQRLADAMFLIVAIRRMHRACTFARRQFPLGCEARSVTDRAIAAFEQDVPSFKLLRDATEHFDAWIVGDGKGQSAAGDDYHFRTKGSHVTSANGKRTFLFDIDGLEVDLVQAADAAIELGIAITKAFTADSDRLIQATWAAQRREDEVRGVKRPSWQEQNDAGTSS